MDKANLALVRYLLSRRERLHLVGHEIDPWLAAHEMVTAHRVPVPAGSRFFGSPLLDMTARTVARRLRRNGGQVHTVANGGNFLQGDINWVHCVHSAWHRNYENGPGWFQAKNRIAHAAECRREYKAFRRARVIVANSNLTKRYIQECLGGESPKVHTVYLGSDPGFRPPTDEERLQARRRWGIAPGRRVALFVGALGLDNNKGFDTLFETWRRLCGDPDWDVDLLAAGGGRAVPEWKAKVRGARLEDRIRMLGFCDEIPELLAAADLLVSPVRYETYGLNVHEAVCRGLPALTSARAGIAERFPEELRAMLLLDPENIPHCIERLMMWRSNPEDWAARFRRFGTVLNQRDWNRMSVEIIELIERSLLTGI